MESKRAHDERWIASRRAFFSCATAYHGVPCHQQPYHTKHHTQHHTATTARTRQFSRQRTFLCCCNFAVQAGSGGLCVFVFVRSPFSNETKLDFFWVGGVWVSHIATNPSSSHCTRVQYGTRGTYRADEVTRTIFSRWLACSHLAASAVVVAVARGCSRSCPFGAQAVARQIVVAVCV